MVNSNELRANNYYLIDGKLCKLDKDEKSSNMLIPIKLNAEILHRNGFEADDLIYSIDFDEYFETNISKEYGNVDDIDESSSFRFTYKLDLFDIDIYFLNGEFVKSELTDDNGGSMKVPCEYVHQLQNLIFALTGKEFPVSFGYKNSIQTIPNP